MTLDDVHQFATFFLIATAHLEVFVILLDTGDVAHFYLHQGCFWGSEKGIWRLPGAAAGGGVMLSLVEGMYVNRYCKPSLSKPPWQSNIERFRYMFFVVFPYVAIKNVEIG